MFNFQNEKEYKSILKTFVFYVDKLLTNKNRPGLSDKDMALYTHRLGEMVPALVNLSEELNTFYEANLPIVSAQKSANKVGIAEALIPELKKYLYRSPHFRDIPLSFDITSSNFISGLKQTQTYVNSDNDDYFNIKSAYYAQRCLNAAYTSLLDENIGWRAQLWKAIEESNFDSVFSSILKNKHFDNGLSTEKINLTIYNGCVAYIEKSQKNVSDGLYKALLDSCCQQQIPMATDAGFQKALQYNLPKINKILRASFPDYYRMKNIENILIKIGEEVEDYDAETISDIVNWQKVELDEEKFNQSLLAKLTFTQEDMNSLLNTYDYSQLEKDTAIEYNDYKKLARLFHGYERRQIQSEDVKNYFGAKFKTWRQQTSIRAAKYLQEILSPNPKSNTQIEDVLECAKDVIMIGKVSGEIYKIPNKDGSVHGIALDTSGFGLAWVKHFISDPSQIKKHNLNQLAKLFSDYGKNCRTYVDYLDLTPQEQAAAEKISADKYLHLLSSERPGQEKSLYVHYSQRIFEVELRTRENNLLDFTRDFNRRHLASYDKPRKELSAYLHEGEQFVSALNENVQAELQKSIEDYCVGEVIIPLYLQREFDQADFDLSMDGIFNHTAYSPEVKEFAKSAAKGYQRSVMKVHQQQIEQNGISPLQKNLACFYERNLEALADQEAYCQTLDTMNEEEALWSRAYRAHQEYKQNRHPSNNLVTQLILNASKRR